MKRTRSLFNYFPSNKMGDINLDLHSEIEITDDIVTSTKKLTLTVLESTSLTPGTKITINAAGLPNSIRKKKDGSVYFGSVKYLNDNPSFPYNDFVMPPEETGFGKRHFMIKFMRSEKDYFLKDLADGTGTFARIDAELFLKNGFIISFGDSHMVVQINEGKGHPADLETGGSIALKFLEGPKADQRFTFNASDSPIIIGRTEQCKIRFAENTLSRNQCRVFYKNSNWILCDGLEGKPSTNGTWLFVDDFYKIKNQMVFKAGQTLFQVEEN